MEMKGSRTIPASPAAVWAKLNDAAVLQRSIPGCVSLEQRTPTDMTGVVAVKVGPVNAKFSGEVTLSDIDPPKGYKITGTGKGGAAGAASGSAQVALSPADGGGTLLSYVVDAKVSGKLAQLGGRLIDATAAKLAGQFFDNFQEEFPPPAEDAAETAAAEGGAAVATPSPAAADGAGRKKSSPWLWLAAVAAAVAVVVFLASR